MEESALEVLPEVRVVYYIWISSGLSNDIFVSTDCWEIVGLYGFGISTGTLLYFRPGNDGEWGYPVQTKE